MSNGGFEFPVNSGNAEADRQTLASLEQQYQSAGMSMTATPLASGGYHVKVVPAGQAQAGYGQAAVQAGHLQQAQDET